MYDRKVWITDWQGQRQEMTPEELLEFVKTDSESNWYWFAPVAEIVKTISNPDFPEPIANELKCIILKCLATLLLSVVTDDKNDTDQIAVAYCYYSMRGGAGKRTRRLYRKNLVHAVTAYIGPISFNTYNEEYREFRAQWEEDAFQHFTERFGNDFMRFRTNIEEAFCADLKEAEKSGRFKINAGGQRERLKNVAKIFAQ